MCDDTYNIVNSVVRMTSLYTHLKTQVYCEGRWCAMRLAHRASFQQDYAHGHLAARERYYEMQPHRGPFATSGSETYSFILA